MATAAANPPGGGAHLLIFPCNGNALEALDCLGTAWGFAGFVDDTPSKLGTDRWGNPVHPRSALAGNEAAFVLAVPGSASSFRSRRQLIEGLGIAAHRWATVVHPTARVSPLARVGRNVLIMAGAVITSNAAIGDHVCILPNTVIHHDVRIGAWSLIGSNVTVAGSCVVGENCYIGSGSSIRDRLTIGDGALIGLGSNVVRDVGASQTVAGNPARPR
jgi:sugar O-acyltransferase (sialic acid O-acetyltransferase NeuD family)